MKARLRRNPIRDRRVQVNAAPIDYQVNPDEMTYEELLELEEKIGKVNKGLDSCLINVSRVVTIVHSRDNIQAYYKNRRVHFLIELDALYAK